MQESFDIWEFWQRVKGVKRKEEFAMLHDEFLLKTKDLILSEKEYTVKVYLQGKIKEGGSHV